MTTLRRLVVLALLPVALAGCARGPAGAAALDDVVRSIARSQQVDEALVRNALRSEAGGTDEQLRLARQWERELRPQPLPDLAPYLDDLAEHAREQLAAAACEAVLDAVRDGEVPNGAYFVQQYLTSLVTDAIPGSDLQGIADEFDTLYPQASDGDLTALDVRLTIMKYQYC